MDIPRGRPRSLSVQILRETDYIATLWKWETATKLLQALERLFFTGAF